MGLRHIFHAIFIWPVLLLLRGVTSPFIALGQLLRWLFYSLSSITSGTTPAYYYGDDGSTTTTDGDNKISRHGDCSFDQHGENLKFRNRLAPSSLKGLTNDDVHRGNIGGSSPASVNGDPHVTSPPVPKSQTFYAINVSPKTLERSDNPQLVFQEKNAMLKEMKKYKGARFKVFSTKQDAIDYSQCVPDPCSTPVKSAIQNEDTAGNSPHPTTLEKSNLKAPKQADLVKLRKCIETGDYQTVQEMISNNPRFLISCGDTPSILHEGTRYNALHVASKNNQPEIIKLLIQTIEDPNFFVKLYGQEQNEMRVRNLVDLYLNTPDKGPCETPLHFACKFGHKECVKVLVSHPLTIRNRKNKFDETPADLICRRVDKSSKQLQDDIREYLEGICYVPLYGDEDNIVSPIVGNPCSPTFSTDTFSSTFALPTSPFSPEASVLSPRSPHKPQPIVKAYAGPMSPSQADHFRKLWRSPCSRNKQIKVVREDHEKGYERIGRDLALQENIQWSEYWGFLDEYTDLSKPQGIQKLEYYLQKQSLAVNVQSSLEAIQQSTNHSSSPRLTSASSRLESMKNALFSDVDDYENRPKNNDVNFEESSLGSSVLSPQPTTSQAQFEKPSSIQVEEMDVSPPFENGTTMQQNQHDIPEKKELSFREENLEEIMDTLAKDFGTKLIIMSPEVSSDDSFTKKPDLPVSPEVNTNMNCLFSLKDEISDMLSAVQNEGPLSVSFMTQATCDKPTATCLSPMSHVLPSPKSSTTTETVLLKVKSPNKLIAEINGVPAKKPPELKTPLKVFLQGTIATKLDIDVQHCLKDIPLDSEQFPYTAKWLELINTLSEKEQKSLPSPAKAYGRQERSSDGTPVLKSHTVRRLEPMSLFKSPSTAI